MLQITLGITGDEELALAFQAMSSRVTDWRPYWPAIAGVFYESERARFASNGFGTWPPLSDGYAAWKSKAYPGEGILSRTGDLRNSLTSRFNPNAVYEDEAQSLLLGTTVPYAAIHQTGASTFRVRSLRRLVRALGLGTMPARPPIGLRDSDEELMSAVALIQFHRYADALGFETKAA